MARASNCPKVRSTWADVSFIAHSFRLARPKAMSHAISRSAKPATSGDASLGVATAAALLIAVGLLSVPAANAQVQSPSPGLSDQSPNISDQKLDAVATAI